MKCGCKIRIRVDDHGLDQQYIQFCPLHAAAPEIKAENARLLRLLTSLTPGGSEFLDADACAQYIRDRLNFGHEAAKRNTLLRAALEAAPEIEWPKEPSTPFGAAYWKWYKGPRAEVLKEKS